MEPIKQIVTPFERGRYWVESRRANEGVEPWLVDVEEFEMNGACDCCDFEFNHLPLLVRGAKPSDATRCWHIKQALKYEKAVAEFHEGLASGKIKFSPFPSGRPILRK